MNRLLALAALTTLTAIAFRQYRHSACRRHQADAPPAPIQRWEGEGGNLPVHELPDTRFATEAGPQGSQS